jgi:hypothetical protein
VDRGAARTVMVFTLLSFIMGAQSTQYVRFVDKVSLGIRMKQCIVLNKNIYYPSTTPKVLLSLEEFFKFQKLVNNYNDS